MVRLTSASRLNTEAPNLNVFGLPAGCSCASIDRLVATQEEREFEGYVFQGTETIFLVIEKTEDPIRLAVTNNKGVTKNQVPVIFSTFWRRSLAVGFQSSGHRAFFSGCRASKVTGGTD